MRPNQDLKLFSVSTAAAAAHTLVPLDEKGSGFNYVPVRRMGLFLQQSIANGAQWSVFEPNTPALWTRLRATAEGLLHGLFLQGSFQGKTPAEAYFVKCDAVTTTQADLAKGIVNIVVGFAPLKPAEFVVIQIQLMSASKPPH